jgi:hypothetical protein
LAASLVPWSRMNSGICHLLFAQLRDKGLGRFQQNAPAATDTFNPIAVQLALGYVASSEIILKRGFCLGAG